MIQAITRSFVAIRSRGVQMKSFLIYRLRQGRFGMLILENALVAVKRRAEHGEVRTRMMSQIVNIYILGFKMIPNVM